MTQRDLAPWIFLFGLGGCVASIELGDAGESSSTGDPIQTSMTTPTTTIGSTSAATDSLPTDDSASSDGTEEGESTGGSPASWCLETIVIDGDVPPTPMVADVDGDGVPELWALEYEAATTTARPFTVAIDGTATALPPSTRPGNLRRFVDIDGDGLDDAVFEDPDDVRSWVQGLGDATLGEEQRPLELVEAASFGPNWADANSDGIADILVVREDPATLQLWIGDGDGGFDLVEEEVVVGVEAFFGNAEITPSTEPPFLPEVKGFALGAENGAIGFGIEGALAVVTVDSTSALDVSAATDYRPWQRAIGMGELDDQAPADLVAMVDLREVVLWHGEADGGFTPQVIASTKAELSGAALGDFRGDGTRDILVATAEGVVLLYPAPVSEGFIGLEVNGTLDTSLAYRALDVDGDGRMELYGASSDVVALVRIVGC